MFVPSERVSLAVGALMAAAESYAKGSVMPWVEVSAAMEMHYRDSMHIVNKFRRELRKTRGIATWCEPDWGIRFLTDQEVVRDVPRKRRRRIVRQYSKTLQDLNVADVGKLSQFEAQTLAKERAAAETLRNAAIQEQRTIKALFRQSDVPRRPVTE